MPIYEYRCGSCGSVSEFLVGVSSNADNASLACEDCGGRQLERLLSRINIGQSLASFAAPCGDACGVPRSERAGCCGGSCQGH